MRPEVRAQVEALPFDRLFFVSWSYGGGRGYALASRYKKASLLVHCYANTRAHYPDRAEYRTFHSFPGTDLVLPVPPAWEGPLRIAIATLSDERLFVLTARCWGEACKAGTFKASDCLTTS